MKEVIKAVCFGWIASCLQHSLLTTMVMAKGPQAKCTLASLILRFQDSPIDLDPAFEPYIDSYKARLDWSYESFSLDARPDINCEVEGVPAQPRSVPIGGTETVDIYVFHPDIGEKRRYRIEARRQLGSETELKYLSVEGGEISPFFSPSHREYSVSLDLTSDVVRVVYGLSDNEQRIMSSAKVERPAGEEDDQVEQAEKLVGGQVSDGVHGTRGSRRNSSDAKGRRLGSRRLATSSGEVQFEKAHVDFLLDVGFVRTIQLTVQCADPTQASIGAYVLHVARPGCTLKRPYFDPEKHVCVNFCTSGYYRNHQTHRCSRCNDNCKICSGLLECQMCAPDTADFSYAIQPDGKCRAMENHLFRRYRWWCAGLGVLLLFLVSIGICGFVQLWCSKPRDKSARFTRLNDTDSDERDDDLPRYAGGSRFARY